jgi:hypothetical protein
MSQQNSFSENTNIVLPFPVDAFPDQIKEIILATNRCLNFPTDFTGTSMLYAASVAIGNTHKIKVREGWLEPPVLFVANIGLPNTMKSHPLSFAVKPFIDMQNELYQSYDKAKEKYEFEMKLTQQKRDELNLNPQKPLCRKFILMDFTSEALAKVHNENPRGVGVYCDELGSWWGSFNRYNKGADEQLWLSLWSGITWMKDRSLGDLIIRNPYVPVGGSTQPSNLSQFCNSSAASSGLVDRFLFAYPEGLKKPYWSTETLNQVYSNNWFRIIKSITDISPYGIQGNSIPAVVIPYSKEAYDVIVEWQTMNTDRCNEEYNVALASGLGKLEIQINRIALILEILGHACLGRTMQPIKEVGIQAAQGAIKLIEYYASTLRKVHQLSNPLDSLDYQKRNLYNALPQVFTSGLFLEIASSHKLPADTVNKWLPKWVNIKILERLKAGEYRKLR